MELLHNLVVVSAISYIVRSCIVSVPNATERSNILKSRKFAESFAIFSCLVTYVSRSYRMTSILTLRPRRLVFFGKAITVRNYLIDEKKLNPVYACVPERVIIRDFQLPH